jgi:hypothetical protein
MVKYLSNSRRRHPAAFAAQRSQVYAGCVNLPACGHPYRFAGRDDSAHPGMNRSRVGKFAKVLSGTRKLVDSKRCGLAAIQAVSEIDW